MTTATGQNRYWLSGAGAGVSIGKPDRYLVKVVYAHRIGENPGRSAGGMNADGRDDPDRFWFQGVLYF